jgi:AraC-like DNA-binding protein
MKNEVVHASIPNLPIHIAKGISGKKGNACEMHFHDEIELLKVTRGAILCTTANKTYRVCAGDIIFVNSRIPHYTTVDEDFSQTFLLQINADELSDDIDLKYLLRFISRGDKQAMVFKACEERTLELCGYVDNIESEYQIRESAYETYIKANVFNILAFLYRNNALIDSSAFFDVKFIDKILPVLLYIEENYNEPVSLETVSNILNLNQQYFCRLFKKITNRTFTDYLNFVRVCKAEKLLSSTSKSVMEISLEVGFSSVSYFNRIFKRYESCTPTAYRKLKYAQA